jgi:cyclic nucleotide-binding protein/histidine kinase/DNA gyrase B/HSP90-like ATPase
LRWIADAGTERSVQDGELIFSQGAPPRHLLFILEGGIAIKRHTSSPVTVFTGRSGRITGKTPFSRIRQWNADGRASGNVWLLEIREDQFPALLTAIPSMTERIVRALIDRNREYTRAEEQIEPFFTTKPFGEGLGLGLDTVQRVVAKHFGAVAFDTSAQGTTFHVRLPIDRAGIY